MGKMTFGEAIVALKKGKRVARAGWNGKGMYLVYFSPVGHGLEMLTVYDKEGGTTLPLLPFTLMKTADNMYVPWLASQTDVLAEDYEIVEAELQEDGYYVWGNKTTNKTPPKTELTDETVEKINKAFDTTFKHLFGDIKATPKTLSEALNVKKIADDFNSDFNEDEELEKVVDDALVEISELFKIPVDMLIHTKYYSTDKKDEDDEECSEAPKPVDESVTDFKAMELKIIEQITELSSQLKHIQDEKERAKGSIFDTVYAPDDIVLTVNVEKNKSFWDFVRKAKANNHKRIVLVTGEQYKINNDFSVTQIL